MTLLNFDNGESFATGAIGYDYRPATKTETTNRIFLEVEIQGIPTLYYKKTPEYSYV